MKATTTAAANRRATGSTGSRDTTCAIFCRYSHMTARTAPS
jgi:hypothetical protein